MKLIPFTKLKTFISRHFHLIQDKIKRIKLFKAPPKKRKFKRKKKNDATPRVEVKCQNCDTPFTGKFCPNCGQSVLEFERPLKFMIVDFMGTIITFDTRLIRTLKAILFKPGKLTLDYTRGKRARYMPPFRFYVFISFVLFLLTSIIAGRGIENNDNFVAIGNDESSEIKAIVDSIRSSENPVYDSVRKVFNINYDSKTTQQDSVANLKETVFKSKLEKKLHNQSRDKLLSEHPEIFVNKYLKILNYSLFLLMPIFAFFMWLFFMKQNKYYITHLIFSLNIHSFLFLILSVIIATNLIFPEKTVYPEPILLALIPVYHISGIRRIYRASWIKSILMPLLVWLLYFLILAVVSVILIVLAVVII
ncbi:MAG: DUF3667 domain-containing protein [Bacteroidales bacterium]|nr:DUF3667 domain-containing protein [Bacteroidales bacterium]MBN2821390.1 DUF3667 domain-containing protein [Bacteroidales bacterium]